MIFGFFVLFVALAISAVAAYYSIMGLTAIFAAAVMPIVIMGVALEVGKITATVWLHNYWDRASIQFKMYLVPAIAVLMIITSMGIFGFLSKAHLDQAVPSGDIAAKVAIFDERIATERENIAANKQTLQQMDKQVNEMLTRTTDSKGTNRAVQIRKQQAKERTQLQNDIAKAQQNIIDIQAQRAPVASEVRKVEAEVGPIKYIAALIYGDNPDANLLERAVRWVIILLVFVFDPLALILILAADQTFIWAREKKLTPLREATFDDAADNAVDWVHNVPDKEFADVLETIDNPPAPTEEAKEFFEKYAEPATEQQIDTPEEFSEAGEAPVKQTYLDTPWVGIPVPPYGTPPKEDNTFDPPPINTVFRPPPLPEVDDKPIEFGGEFPPNPYYGEMFLRTDTIPSELYRWNQKNWIMVDKKLTDQYSYNDEYIAHLVSKLRTGEYDVELLTVSEGQQIKEYLDATK